MMPARRPGEAVGFQCGGSARRAARRKWRRRAAARQGRNAPRRRRSSGAPHRRRRGRRLLSRPLRPKRRGLGRSWMRLTALRVSDGQRYRHAPPGDAERSSKTKSAPLGKRPRSRRCQAEDKPACPAPMTRMGISRASCIGGSRCRSRTGALKGSAPAPGRWQHRRSRLSAPSGRDRRDFGRRRSPCGRARSATGSADLRGTLSTSATPARASAPLEAASGDATQRSRARSVGRSWARSMARRGGPRGWPPDRRRRCWHRRRAATAIRTRLGASRMSSVLGLKARPHTPMGDAGEGCSPRTRRDLVDEHALLAVVNRLHGGEDLEIVPGFGGGAPAAPGHPWGNSCRHNQCPHRENCSHATVRTHAAAHQFDIPRRGFQPGWRARS